MCDPGASELHPWHCVPLGGNTCARYQLYEPSRARWDGVHQHKIAQRLVLFAVLGGYMYVTLDGAAWIVEPARVE